MLYLTLGEIFVISETCSHELGTPMKTATMIHQDMQRGRHQYGQGDSRELRR